MKKLLIKATVTAGSIVFLLLLLLVADRLLGWLAPPQPALIFEPGRTVHYETPEFSFDVRTNNLGFRDRDFSLEKERPRILALGDSFTYGWGVELENGWVKRLEAGLRESGHDVEIANLGQGGTTTSTYADIAARAVPLLQPDLVLVNVLQGDDLGQVVLALQDRRTREHAAGPVRRALTRSRSALKWAYPNLVARLRGIRTSPLLEIRAHWLREAEAFAADLDAAGRAQFDQLDARIREPFLRGELNPGLISLAATHPDHLQHTFELADPAVRAAIDSMALDLGRIRDLAAEVGAGVLVVAVPAGIYVAERNWLTYRDIGFVTEARFLSGDEMDAAIRQAAERAGLPFVTVTAAFREESRRRDLFHELDGHLNVDGNRFFAEAVQPMVAAHLEALK